ICMTQRSFERNCYSRWSDVDYLHDEFLKCALGVRLPRGAFLNSVSYFKSSTYTAEVLKAPPAGALQG
ncbi:MAG TPA: hypothetical protein VFD63_02030, partial [Pyrinomonadaceae bacterium]|nr:hypothetical protein [Pyrinomonadaceae bacterium]